MKNLEKFADYGLTGTFFLVTQAAVLLTLYPGAEGTSSGWWNMVAGCTTAMQKAVGELVDLSGTPLPQLLTVLGVAAVFFCGLLRDLLGHWLVVFELRVFRRHLRHHRNWVRTMVRGSRGRVTEDVERFLSEDAGNLFRLWRHYQAMFRSLGTYLRLWFLLVAYVASFCPSPDPEALADNLRLWHVTRSVSTTLVVVAFELWVSCFPFTAGFEIWAPRLGFAFAAFGLAISLDYAAYNRLCACMFSFGLTTFENRREQARVSPSREVETTTDGTAA